MQMQPRYARMRLRPDAAESDFRVRCGGRRGAAAGRIDSMTARSPGRMAAPKRLIEVVRSVTGRRNHTHAPCAAARRRPRGHCAGERRNRASEYPVDPSSKRPPVRPPTTRRTDSSYAMTTEGRMGGHTPPVIQSGTNQAVRIDRGACAHQERTDQLGRG